MNPFMRTEMLLGPEGLEILRNSSVAVFGLGGVGSFSAESLARAGVGHLTLIDHDTVSVTNINRQLVALHSTVGKKKVDVMKERILDINPAIKVEARDEFYNSEKREDFFLKNYNYIIDAIDTVSAKLDLIKTALEKNIPIVTAMGMANKLDPGLIRIGDISQTKICPLAKVMRKELGKAGIRKGVKVVYSLEPPLVPRINEAEPLPQGRRSLPGSVSFVPPAAGIFLTSVVVNHLLAEIVEKQERKG